MRTFDEREQERKVAADRQRAFFDALAADWRRNAVLDAATLEKLFDGVPFRAGQRVLDVGCGTGALEAFLAGKGLTVDAIDVSPAMIARAVSAGVPRGVCYLVADFYTYETCGYDHIVVFDAYPHFTDKPAFAARAAAVLVDGGRLTVLFDESRPTINGYHRDCAGISTPLRPVDDEAAAFASRFDVAYSVDDGTRYRLDLIKKVAKTR